MILDKVSMGYIIVMRYSSVIVLFRRTVYGGLHVLFSTDTVFDLCLDLCS